MPEVGVSRRSSSSMGGPSKPGPGSAAKPKKGPKQPQQGQETPSSSSSGVVFAGHENYIAAMAKSCRDNQKFTDVKIQCEDGEIRAHRLVLGAHSCFLREMFLDLPEGMQEYTLIIPQAKTKTVSILIDFLYTGKMILHRNNSSDLQKLVSVLKIDPENVRIEAVDGISSSNTPGPKTPKNGTKPQGKKLVQQTIGASVLRMRDPGNNANKGIDSSSKPQLQLDSNQQLNSRSSKQQQLNSNQLNSSLPVNSSTPVVQKAAKASKRSLDQADLKTSKVAKRSSQDQADSSLNESPSKLKRRSTARRSNSTSNKKTGKVPKVTLADTEGQDLEGSGFHDMTNVETWVCAICKRYDPVYLAGDEKKAPPTTEWVGCDCNRWFHQYCTKLKTVDDTFSCKNINLSCLE